MPNLDGYFDAIDTARIRRAKELSEIKSKFSRDQDEDPSNVNSKAAVVLTYANWEGFYNDCVRTYVSFLREIGRKVRETDWMLIVGTVNSDFETLRSKNHSASAKLQFVANLRQRLECKFESFDSSIIEARSNLDFNSLSHNYKLLHFDLQSFQKFRLRLDKELVGWRHRVAHGDSPDLSSMDIADHIDFAALLLILVADSFQYGMLERM